MFKVGDALLQGNLVLEQALQMVRHYFCCLSGGQLSAEEVAAFTSVFEVGMDSGFRACCIRLRPSRLSVHVHPLPAVMRPAMPDDSCSELCSRVQGVRRGLVLHLQDAAMSPAELEMHCCDADTVCTACYTGSYAQKHVHVQLAQWHRHPCRR